MTYTQTYNLVGPKFVQYYGPLIEALKELGGSGRAAEVTDRVAERLELSDEELAETLPSGASRFRNKVAWARFYLAKGGYIDASRHGVWSLTDRGRSLPTLTHDQAYNLFKEIHSQFPRPHEEVSETEEQERTESEAPAVNQSYRDQLSTQFLALAPPAFERFCQRLLREAGFEQVSVTGRSGDGGIDGIGILQVNRLVSFKVLFQCKRYTGSVSPGQVRDFRGAMQGRADKGIIITTGSFTADARKEAVRDGVPPIELVDGDALLDMCEELQLGLRPVQTFEFNEQFFAEFT